MIKGPISLICFSPLLYAIYFPSIALLIGKAVHFSMSEITLDLLPQDCFVHIMSLTSSPQDVCRAALVSSQVRSMADSDAVWEKLLPSNYEEILSRLVSPLLNSSKKELFSRLCKPQLIDEGRKVYTSIN
jgi:hypothetical protein